MAFYDFSKLEDIRVAMERLRQQVIFPEDAIGMLAAAIETLTKEIQELKSKAG